MKKRHINGLISIVFVVSVGLLVHQYIDNKVEIKRIETENRANVERIVSKYTTSIDAVREIFTESNLNVADSENDIGDTIIECTSNNTSIGSYTDGKYETIYNENSIIDSISASITLSVQGDYIKNDEFIFEETKFYDLHNLFMSEINTSEEITKSVNEAYKKSEYGKKLEFKKDKYTEVITIDRTYIQYEIIIKK